MGRAETILETKVALLSPPHLISTHHISASLEVMEVLL